ncbi:MAG TPA: N-acetylglucosamine-6-phosphate deacetylase, partial [Woeseiaceae bacterium]|nr:N-acetylglucosamine-6-phosphate deacetylase [Woeseiaceae bacterium]
GRVLTDAGLEEGLAVVIEGERITAVGPRADVDVGDAEVVDLEGNLLLPGFIDIQVNGGGGALFNGKPTVETIAEIGRVHRQFGTTGFLPTLVSDDLDVVADAIAATREAIAAAVPGVLGLHIEGPFLNEERRGVHDASKIRNLDEEAFRLLTTPTGGKTLITLAPEKTTPAMIRALTDAGVIVSAGHSNATYAQVRDALAAGLTGFTHLFNAMSQLTVREPGVVGAALDDADSWCSIIVDGYHVDPVVLRLAMRIKRRDRFLLVTDAMPSVGAGVKSFNLLGREIDVQNGVCVDEEGTLAGSDMDMSTAVRNAITMLHIGVADAVRMASCRPAEFLGLSKRYGKIAPGFRANFVITDEELTTIETWVDGSRS